MAFEPGGRADKLGNRYEGLWVAKQLLELLKEELQSVTVEAIGDDEIGVDMWVVSKEGVRFAHQCKARNKSKPAWTIADLGRAGVIGKMEYQLKRDPNCQAVFVSAVSAIELCDMCHSARNSTND